MRILSEEESEERGSRILQAVIHLFIKTGKPVGSNSVLEHFRLNLSPASVRHVMGELEEEGFLTHPHTSAGRIPTDKGYRHYVNSLSEIQRLAMEEEARIRREYLERLQEIEELMSATSRILSTLSHCAGFVLAPTLEESRLRHMELIPLDERRCLAILVSESGHVRHELFEAEAYQPRILPAINRMMNEKLRGLPFSEIRDRMNVLFSDVEHEHLETWMALKEISRKLFTQSPEGHLYIDGTNNVFSFPEFQDSSRLLDFMRFVEERKTLGEILTKELAEEGLHVRIGAENATPELRNFSLVSSTYSQGGRPIGVLGILGPKRMEYPKMIGLVNTVVDLLNRVLDRLKGF